MCTFMAALAGDYISESPLNHMDPLITHGAGWLGHQLATSLLQLTLNHPRLSVTSVFASISYGFIDSAIVVS